MRGIDQACWLADKIPAYGDYAKEAANVLRRQAYELERLHKENEKLRRVVKASEEFVSAESLVDKRKFYIELEQVLRATGYGGGWRELHTGILGLLTDCAEIERLKQVRCEGCGYLVSEREHLGCKSEKTLKDLERLTTERDNAEKREYEVLGRANALEAELKATQARLVASDKLLREEFAQRQDALATLRDIGDFAQDRSTGPAVEDALWEVRRMANAKVS